MLILGDGYTAAERAKFEKDARRLVDILFATSPFKERKADFNVWGLCPPAAESGISRPSTGVWRRAPAGSQYDAFGSERYVLTFDNRAFRDVAAFAPYEFVEILVNGADVRRRRHLQPLCDRGRRQRLGAVHLRARVRAPLRRPGRRVLHVRRRVPARERSASSRGRPNATALRDPERLKWKDLVTAGTPLPTPWNKEAFEAHSRAIQQRRRAIRAANRPEADMDALFTEQQAEEVRMLGAERYAQAVGAFEGAMYEARGYYRPQVDCIMFTRNPVPFCAVCRRALTAVIDLYAPGGQSQALR